MGMGTTGIRAQLAGIVGQPAGLQLRSAAMAGGGKGPTPPAPIFGQQVGGFSMTAEQLVVDGLPAGVLVPGDVFLVIAAAKRVDAWLDRGRQVHAWAVEHGAGDVSFYDDERDGLRLPAALADREVPGFVTSWLAEADEIEQLLGALG